MMDRSPRLIRFLLRLYPRSFRDRYADAMLAFYAERFAEAERRGESRARVWMRALADLVVGVSIEYGTTPRYGPRAEPSTEDTMSALIQEFVVATRGLRKSRTFTAAAVLTLALGIASTTSIFSIVQSVMLAPLPFPQAERVVVPLSRNKVTGNTWPVTYADFMDWRDNHVFDKVAVYQSAQMDLVGSGGSGDPVRVPSAAVSAQFFGALSVTPSLGRVLQPADYPPTAPRAVVISDRLWRTQFGGRPDVIGLIIEANAIKRPIVGVMPKDARWPMDVDLWVPLRYTTELDPDLQRRDNFLFGAIARLERTTTLDQTRAAMGHFAERVAAEHPDIRKDVTTEPIPLLEEAVGESTIRALWILLGAVGLLLLIGCVNVANLQLARAAGRQREFAVRVALGASRVRLARQTLIESGVLALIGGALGVLLAQWMIKLIVAIAPHDVPRLTSASLDLAALAFAFIVSLGIALLFGFVPALHAARSDAGATLGDGGTRTSAGRASSRTRRALVTVELALSVILLVGAGLSIRSITRLRHVDAGFATGHVLAASISLPGIRYNNDAKVVSFMYALQSRLASAPGIQAAGIASASPLGAGGFYLGRRMIEEGKGPGPQGEIQINWVVATPGYLGALGVPILHGRDFTARDDSANTPVMIVNVAFAKAMFGDGDPIGKRAMSSRDEKVYREIIGVVGNVKFFGANDSTRALVWVPFAQKNAWHGGIITVRAAGEALTALPAVRRALKEVDGGIALAGVTTMDQAMAQSIAQDRLLALLLGAFASLALILAAVGVFGVLSYMLERRTHELGIRVALGARRSDVLALVATETIPMVGAGILFGLLAAFWLATFVRSMLYEVTATDPLTYGAVAVLLAVVAMVAALMPARHAADVDPVIALRAE